MLGVGRSGEISMRRQFFLMGARGIWHALRFPSVSWDSWVSWDETPFILVALNRESMESNFDTSQVTRLAKHLL